MTKVLVVDDSALMRKLLGRIFSKEADFEVQFARNGLEALELLAAFEPDVVTLDIHMPQMDGLACLDRIMVERPCPVVMVSSLTAEGAEVTLQALRLGAIDFVAKPEGAISLHIDELTDELITKVRAASTARIRSSARLRERVRHRIGRDAPAILMEEGRRAPGRHSREPRRAVGEGLVVVGTSTGGPPALEAVLTALPAGFRWPIVVAQHMPATFTGALARRLDGVSALNVVEVVRTLQLQPGCVYIGKGDADVAIDRRPSGLVAVPVRSQADYPWHPSTDRLVRSAMDHVSPAQIVGILMTGMGSDGAEAMALLRARGGRTIAEAEETAVVWGMPGELVAAGGADWVLPLPEIAGWLTKLVP
ncbi:protein-glutamate methylesterase/protein-glutamine glutaminase [Reyranella soli]|uniref:Protein-glutamate methylesterase/protein-glutamine glutaminase n=1 Tax=Reyranella soli TaxID=1230389 RepID=A0A512NLN7_9HYPH|nr:chemotaxis response regulator protein-glutamate methylesterase [Reyranella soli]GEP59865.1 chemotaxis response regulator protein-glutamate methylesterase 3 [Reyranella soli]